MLKINFSAFVAIFLMFSSKNIKHNSNQCPNERFMKKHFCERGCLTEREALIFSEQRNNNLTSHLITENHVFTGQTTFQTSLGKKP